MRNDIKTYNKKGFLLPDSIRSMAAFHAKIMDDGEYMFRLHDCIGGIRLRGNANNPEEAKEAIEKLRCLAGSANEFADFFEKHYLPET